MSAVDRVATAMGDRAQRDAPLGARTTYRVGGRCDLLVAATSVEDLVELARALRGTGLPVLVVGRGSNLLVADAGFQGVAVTLGGAFEQIEVRDGDGGPSVRAGAAVALPVLARQLAERGLRGMEWAVGVPGSVGGAVRMNAGGHGSDIAASILDAELVELGSGASERRLAGALDLGYRHSNVRADEIVTSATFRLEHGDAAAARAEVAAIVAWRRAHQPGGPNAGSVFANPPGDHAGRLIEAAGARGLRLGSARVSEKHANFIQADTGGSADDVHSLIERVRQLVLEHEGVELRTELVCVGFESP